MLKLPGKSVDVVVHIPTGLAYMWIFLGFVTAGLLLYGFFMAAAFKIKLFEGFRKWPTLSKLALFSGPPFIALGLYFSTIQTRDYMLIPLVVYLLISYLALRLKSKDPTGRSDTPTGRRS
jgi:hypothetical protein